MDHSIEDLARALDLRVVRPLAGGEFGATLVADAAGRELVFKVIQSGDFAKRVALGARMAERVRATGYPAPHYVGAGATPGVTWSLQTLLPGEIPSALDRGFAEQLLALAERHKDAAGETGDWLAGALKNGRGAVRSVEQHPDAAALAAEAAAVLERYSAIELRTGDVIHGDFHHRNFLAVGDAISGVFDWELSTPGDWRFDVATLAFWSRLVPDQIPTSMADFVDGSLAEVCPRETRAFFGAYLALNNLAFQKTVHPERLPAFITLLEDHIAPWWRTLL